MKPRVTCSGSHLAISCNSALRNGTNDSPKSRIAVIIVREHRLKITPLSMSDRSNEHPKQLQPWWTAILKDIQFWIPFIVLLTGLLLLRIVQ